LRFAPIVPVEYDPASLTDYHLILAHEVLENDSLRGYYQRLKHHTIILDNSVIELGEPLSSEELSLAYSYFPGSILVLPDEMYESARTIALAEEWFSGDRNNPCLMVVPQGRSPAEWFVCLGQLVKLAASRCERLVVGIGRYSEDWEGGRRYLFEEANRMRIWLGAYHLLGIQHTLDEITWAKEHSQIWGADSSLPGRAALMGVHSEEVPDLRVAPDLLTYEPRIHDEVQAEIIRVVHYVA